MKQATNNILMIRPVNFRYNKQTAVNNYYQKVLNDVSNDLVQKKALLEFDTFVSKLQKFGVNVVVIDDKITPDTPDSIFPNNWVSFHANGSVVIFPMYAKNRRDERRRDIFKLLEMKYGFLINSIRDFTPLEHEEKYLEGTGSMVLDRKNKICYAAISVRTNKIAVMSFCKEFNYKPVLFKAYQNIKDKRVLIYHTNVMMCVADNFVIICLDSIDNKNERDYVIDSIVNSGKKIIEITEEQKHRFAGNMLQVMGDKPYIVMSTSAFNSLTEDQKKNIQNYNEIIHSSLDTIEACGGGSARCMMAEVFLPNK
tara:strand:- start:5107 stop:6039 length:933 start_codon:yes stop_codon:yes gene_type:complete